MVENKYNIYTKAFEEILEEEQKLRNEKKSYPMGSPMWNKIWDRLDRVLKRKKAYEDKVRLTELQSDRVSRGLK